MINPFFKNHGPITIKKILQSLDINSKENFLDSKIIDILLGKIDRRDSGAWGKIKRNLLSRQ